MRKEYDCQASREQSRIYAPRLADTLREIAKCAGVQFIDDRNYLARLGTTLREIWPRFLIDVISQKSLELRVLSS